MAMVVTTAPVRGRLALRPDVVQLIVRFGKENRSWGCVRIIAVVSAPGARGCRTVGAGPRRGKETTQAHRWRPGSAHRP